LSSAAFTLPDEPELLQLLEALQLGERIRIVDRVPHAYQSTAPAEVLQLEIDGERRLDLLCKYCKYASGRLRDPGDHRYGVEYEARCYDELLAHTTVPTVGYFGTARTAEGGAALLLLEFAGDAERLAHSPRADALLDAAKWLGRFHAEIEERIHPEPPLWLVRHDRDYYLTRTARARRIARRLDYADDDFERALATFERSLGCLEGPGQTVVHGEYYPKNILVRGHSVLPVDWESAGAGPGEIDLVTLTSGWGDELGRSCREAYVSARWGTGPPPEFQQRLLLARMYVQICWLESRKQVDELRRLASHVAAA
jgi:hypothetical protein